MDAPDEEKPRDDPNEASTTMGEDTEEISTIEDKETAGQTTYSNAGNDNRNARDLKDVEANKETSEQQSRMAKLSRPDIPIMKLEEGIVGWESQDDPEMPLNFAPGHKWLIVSMLSFITFMTPFASSSLAPAIPALEKTYHTTDTTKVSMPVSIYLLGYAVGPLLLSPLSEIYGRYVIFNLANACFCLWLIGSALAPSLDSLIFFRVMTGVGGSAALTVGGGVIADLFPVSQRGSAMTAWMLGPVFGPSCAPVIGGFVAETIGWRWINWLTFIPGTIGSIVMAIVLRETNHQVLIKRKTAKLQKELNRLDLRSCYIELEASALGKRRILLNGLYRPFKMLFTSVIIFTTSMYIAFCYGCLYLLFVTFPFVFQGTYGWSIGITGLVYLTTLVGLALGLGSFFYFSDRTVVRMTKANGGVFEPEMRLPSCIWFALMLPVTFFWYGWSADKHVFWLVPIIGLVPFGTALAGIWMPTQTYIVDAYPRYAASGLAAFTVTRSLCGAFLPLAGPAMYENLGIGWASSVLGFIAVALIPIPTLIYKYGARLRKRFPLDL